MRFPEFTAEWERKKLGEVATFYSGGTPPTSQKEYFNGNIPFIRSGEINSLQTEMFINELGLQKSSAKMVDIGDVLYALYGATSGEVGISKIRGAINQAILCVKSEENNYFIFSYLSREKETIKRIYLQGGQGNLSAEIVKNILISFPTHSEQQKIALFLSLIDERIQTQKKIIEEWEKFRLGLRFQLFKKLEDDNVAVQPIKDLIDYEQPTKYIVSDENYSQNPLFTPVLTANKAFILGYTTEDFGVYDKGDCILFDDFTMDMKYVEFPFKVKSSAIKILKPKRGVSLRYVFEYLLSLNLLSSEHKRHYISEIAPKTIRLPKIEQQKNFSALFSAIENMVAIEKSLLAKYREQKKYLLKSMFI